MADAVGAREYTLNGTETPPTDVLPISEEWGRQSVYASAKSINEPKTINEVPLSSRLWTSADQYRYASSPKTGDHWEKVMKSIDAYDEDMVKGWREDIDTLLVFAGLFSAAVTAFLIESYRWLQPPLDDTSTAILLQILQELRNGTGAIPSVSPETGTSSLAIRVNVFWFSSLALSLSSAIIGILSKQWLREYRRDAALSPKDALMLRQTRLESFEKWRVDDILSTLPLLLQAALVLFFSGIIDLLWSLNNIVAIVLTCEIGVALLVVSMTTVLPSFAIIWNAKLPCAYKSPQAWIFHHFFLSATRLFYPLIRAGRTYTSFHLHLEFISHIKNWTAGDRLCDRFTLKSPGVDNKDDCLGAAMQWVYSEYRDNVSMTSPIFYCLEELDEATVAIATGKMLPSRSRYYLFIELVRNLPPSQERQKFAIELLLRDINAEATSLAQQSTYISVLAGELRFGIPFNVDEDILSQMIHTIRNFVQHSFDGSALSYQNTLDISYIFLFCWRDASDDVRRHALLCLDDIERCIERLSDRTAGAKFGFDFIWLIYRSSETTEPMPQSFVSFYDPLICSERFLLFIRFLDRYSIDDVDPSDPMLAAWKQQKASLAIQGGLDADYFDSISVSSVPDSA